MPGGRSSGRRRDTLCRWLRRQRTGHDPVPGMNRSAKLCGVLTAGALALLTATALTPLSSGQTLDSGQTLGSSQTLSSGQTLDFSQKLDSGQVSHSAPAAASLASLAECPCARLAVPGAHAASTISLNETGHLHLTSKHNFTLNEQGAASGTVRGTIYVHLTAVSTTRVTAEVNIYRSGGSISGHGSARYRRGGATASFSGSMSIDRGTGSYAHVHGSGLSFGGTIQESSHDAITVHVNGRVSD